MFIEELSKRDQENYNLPIKKEYNKIQRNQSLFLYGIAGSGKTTLCLQLAREILEANPEFKIKFIRFGDFADIARNTFDKNFYIRRDNVEKLLEIKHCDLLILDDIGAERKTDFVDQLIYDIINHRYSEKMPMFITSNYSLAKIAKEYHQRIASRIKGMCQVVEMLDVDYRAAETRDKSFDPTRKPPECKKMQKEFGFIDDYNPHL